MYMLCSRCHKRPGVVFISPTTSGESQGLCLVCAKELGIKPVTDLLDKMGINEEQLEAMALSLIHIWVPEITKIMARLKENGWPVGTALTMEQALRQLLPLLGKGGVQNDS